jgi:hypothetical protein
MAELPAFSRVDAFEIPADLVSQRFGITYPPSRTARQSG